jgi:multidrug/hemolysin transport system permease protein
MIWELVKRNVWVYIRNRRSVFFSFMSVLIVIGLYMLFLGKVQVDSIKSIMSGIPGVTVNDSTITPLVNSWIISGLLAVNTVTLSLGVLGTMVFDVESKRISDFIVAPISRTGVVLSYLISAWIVDLAFSLIGLVLGELYVLSGGGDILGAMAMLKVVGILALSVVVSSTIMYFIASFMNSQPAFISLSTIVGTLIGFTSGVYVPQGVLPDAMQKVVVLIPFSHVASLLRQILCDKPLATLFGGLPPEAMASYSKMYGIQLFWGNTEITATAMLGILAGTAVLFMALSALRMRKFKQS